MNSKIIWNELEKLGVKPGECEVITDIKKNGTMEVKHEIKYTGADLLRKKEIGKFENLILKT